MLLIVGGMRHQHGTRAKEANIYPLVGGASQINNRRVRIFNIKIDQLDMNEQFENDFTTINYMQIINRHLLTSLLFV